jgi:hypothetical protein
MTHEFAKPLEVQITAAGKVVYLTRAQFEQLGGKEPLRKLFQ